jgi:phosphotriesterase-related protein
VETFDVTAGKVRTVLGDIDPGELGTTMMHEHLLITFGRWLLEAGEEFDWFEAFGWDPEDSRAIAPISWETSAFVRRRGHPENFRLDDVELAIEETQRYANVGGGTIVDSTNADMTRNATGLRQISEATGVHIVMGSGNYWWRHHPPDMDQRSEQQLSEEIIREVTEGCDGTESRAGIIGEIACDYPMHPNERKALCAGARASRSTGIALQVHPGRDPRAPQDVVDTVIGAGGDPSRTIVCHLDRTFFNPEDSIALAESGCYLEFDLFGLEVYELAALEMPNDVMRINHLQQLIAEGLTDQLLISQDICRKTSLVRYGGDGYAHILENIVPLMRHKGVDEDAIDAILVRNPARILTMVESSAG